MDFDSPLVFQDLRVLHAAVLYRVAAREETLVRKFAPLLDEARMSTSLSLAHPWRGWFGRTIIDIWREQLTSDVPGVHRREASEPGFQRKVYSALASRCH